MTNSENVTEILEGLINRHDLNHILTGLELICGEKADQERIRWQADTLTARHWEQASEAIGVLLRRVHSGL